MASPPARRADRRAVPGRVAGARRAPRSPADLGRIREQRPAPSRAEHRGRSSPRCRSGRPAHGRRPAGSRDEPAHGPVGALDAAGRPPARVAEDLVTRNVARRVRIETPEKITTIEPFTAEEAASSSQRSRITGSTGCGSRCSCSGCAVGGVRAALVRRRPRQRARCGSSAGCNGPGARCGSSRPRPDGPAGPCPFRRSSSRSSASIGTGRPRSGDAPGDGRTPPYVFTSTVGTPFEPRTLTRTFHASASGTDYAGSACTIFGTPA